MGRGWRGFRSSATAKFAVSGLLVLLLVAVADTIILRDIGEAEAIADARDMTRLLGHGVVEPALEDDLLSEDPDAIERLDRIVEQYVVGEDVMRIKIWDDSDTIVYSDEERLIGASFPSDHEEEHAFANDSAVAEITDLSRPENRFERSAEKVLEVYYPVHTPNGTPLMFETYLPYSAVARSGTDIWLTFIAPLVGGLIFLELVQIPLAWSMTRRMKRNQEERERLLSTAIESSNLERLRIAADLHDGVVQDLAGLSYSVRAMADRVGDSSPEVAESLREDSATAKQAVRRLRTLLVEIYPPNLQRSGLPAALRDLVSTLEARGISGSLAVDEALDLPASVEALMFRGAQESLRNVVAHSGASNVSVEVGVDGGRAHLDVVDDGSGFDDGTADDLSDEGHFGLKLLRDLARDADGELTVRSERGSGTRVHLEVPV